MAHEMSVKLKREDIILKSYSKIQKNGFPVKSLNKV